MIQAREEGSVVVASLPSSRWGAFEQPNLYLCLFFWRALNSFTRSYDFRKVCICVPCNVLVQIRNAISVLVVVVRLPILTEVINFAAAVGKVRVELLQTDFCIRFSMKIPIRSIKCPVRLRKTFWTNFSYCACSNTTPMGCLILSRLRNPDAHLAFQKLKLGTVA